ncbi:hypothetical protein GCM10010517_01680 [Streptosporangium fragile]|uniref:Uncharacterized protein n=1 Tax=Streptosporangium fragile TaxID=46186 RepID=A0ABN3VNU5_9ACTN
MSPAMPEPTTTTSAWTVQPGAGAVNLWGMAGMPIAASSRGSLEAVNFVNVTITRPGRRLFPGVAFRLRSRKAQTRTGATRTGANPHRHEGGRARTRTGANPEAGVGRFGG